MARRWRRRLSAPRRGSASERCHVAKPTVLPCLTSFSLFLPQKSRFFCSPPAHPQLPPSSPPAETPAPLLLSHCFPLLILLLLPSCFPRSLRDPCETPRDSLTPSRPLRDSLRDPCETPARPCETPARPLRDPCETLRDPCETLRDPCETPARLPARPLRDPCETPARLLRDPADPCLPSCTFAPAFYPSGCLSIRPYCTAAASTGSAGCSSHRATAHPHAVSTFPWRSLPLLSLASPPFPHPFPPIFVRFPRRSSAAHPPALPPPLHLPATLLVA